MDLLQVEGELTGRVRGLQVEEWSDLELLRIATQGFEVLNLKDSEGALASKLVEQSFGSPLIMQELCSELCEYNGIEKQVDGPELILRRPEWSSFFGKIAATIKPSLIESLKIGPTERRRRTQIAITGSDAYVDMCSALLLAVGRLAPKRSMTPVEISDSMNEFVTNRRPLDQIRRACRGMVKIADSSKGAGDSALDFATNPEKLTVVDPYLIFFIGWGLQGLELPVVRKSA
ncbi:hypothetical protein RHODO2019_12610 [Rhodococcus antarcticus]|uniref:Uncharacterized protein n=1 Tax=Rhodococcus antarcticus TaxID=2987751 RepID=A0ABY6NXK4_9NOCA|nr:hypothetical protein [Rhodococcus antarcticus]UZJ24018.1 hypothetical protein RHODO2019_12610 [Rhodococcus antarcticus]